LARDVATVIALEVHLEGKDKSIQPVDVGGVAGGEKFLTKGILFKLARDWEGIYEGDANSQKAANCEMVAMNAIRYASFFWFSPGYYLARVLCWSLHSLSCLPIIPGKMIWN
jgi:hypothetical protein